MAKLTLSQLEQHLLGAGGDGAEDDGPGEDEIKALKKELKQAKKALKQLEGELSGRLGAARPTLDAEACRATALHSFREDLEEEIDRYIA